jgi:phosphotransferase system  glucose/maltose/N-acetylglucosamine-specific IIC component
MKSRSAETNKPYGVSETIKNILKFKMSIIMILLSLNIIGSTSSNFGGYAAFVAIVACVLLYFFSSIYQPYMPKNSDHSTFGLGNYFQAVKECIPTAEAEHIPTMIERIEKLFGGAKRSKK